MPGSAVAVGVDRGRIVHPYFNAPPEAPATRGFAGILHAGLSSLHSGELLATPEGFLSQFGLHELVSPLAAAPHGRDAGADQAPDPGAGGLAAPAGLAVSRASGRIGSNSSTTFPDGSSSRICLVPMPVTISFRK